MNEFEKWKQNFILNHLSDNIYFCGFVPNKSEPDQRMPKLNIWTSQPIDTLKTMKHL
jgi:hypothetical protein